MSLFMHLEVSFGSVSPTAKGISLALWPGEVRGELLDFFMQGVAQDLLWWVVHPEGQISRPSFATTEQSRSCEGINVQLKVKKLGQEAASL